MFIRPATSSWADPAASLKLCPASQTAATALLGAPEAAVCYDSLLDCQLLSTVYKSVLGLHMIYRYGCSHSLAEAEEGTIALLIAVAALHSQAAIYLVLQIL